MKENIERIKTGDSRRGTPKMFTIVKFWGRRLAGPVFTILLSSLSPFIIAHIYFNHASALTYNNSIDLEYNINPSLDVSFNTNTGFIIEDLAPGNASYSNTVVITASSNNSDGYNLLASVGDSNDINRNNNRLVNTNNVNYFESVAANADLELSALGENKWGYAICNDNDSSNTTTTGTCTTWSNYNGLPAIVTDTNGNIDHNNDITLVSSNTAGTTDILMKIGASATNTQVAGEFTNKINFFVTTNVVTYDYSITYNANDGSDGSSVANMPTNVAGSLNTGDTLRLSNLIPSRESYYSFLGWCDGAITGINCNGNLYQPNDYIKFANASSTSTNTMSLDAVWAIYMQDVDIATCQSLATISTLTTFDKRDNNGYAIRFINGECWMVQNLRIQGTISAKYSNFSGDNFNVSEYDLENDNNVCNVDNGYNNVCSHIPNDENLVSIGNNATKENVGAWYNYAAASAGTIKSISDDNDLMEDICPSNWRLPSGPNTVMGTDANILIGNEKSGYQQLTAGAELFESVVGGDYINGTLSNMAYGLWWTSSAKATQYSHRQVISYDANNNKPLFRGNNAAVRSLGLFIRCVRSE